eukprot:PhF_6_TR21657/c4_g2_i2/m.30861
MYMVMKQEDIDKSSPSRLTKADLKAKLDVGQLIRIDRRDVKSVSKQFCVTEQKMVLKGIESVVEWKDLHCSFDNVFDRIQVTSRRRGIDWTKFFNDHTEYCPMFSLLSTKQQILQAAKGVKALCTDIAMSFSTVPLSKEVQSYHCVRDEEGNWYASTVLVMGSKPAAELMQCITEVLVQARQTTDTVFNVHIDNVRWLSTKEQDLRTCYDIFVENVNMVGKNLKINQDFMSKPHSCGMAFGVLYEYEKGKVALPGKFLYKLEGLLEEILKPMTVQRAYEIMGLMFFGSTVLNINVGRFWYIVKWYRRIASKVERGDYSMDSIVSVWESKRKDFKDWILILQRNEPVDHHVAEHEFTLFTDASNTGYGAVLLHDGMIVKDFGKKTPQEFAGRWDALNAGKHINLLEAKAVQHALEYFGSQLQGSTVRVMIDNTSLLGALKNKYSQSFALNSETQKILERLNCKANFH